MKKYSMLYAIVTLFVLSIFSAEGLCFAGADDIKARMQERLPTIVQMKAEAIIGENNRGFLEFIPGAAKRDENVITAENTDRLTVYGAIARQQSTPKEPVTPDIVGKIRAARIAEMAGPGEWLQDGAGKWYKK